MNGREDVRRTNLLFAGEGAELEAVQDTRLSDGTVSQHHHLREEESCDHHQGLFSVVLMGRSRNIFGWIPDVSARQYVHGKAHLILLVRLYCHRNSFTF